MFYSFNYGYGKKRQTEPDYMDVCKPYFDLDNIDQTKRDGRNVFKILKQEKKDISNSTNHDEASYDTTLAPGLATNANLLTDQNTKRVELEEYDHTKCVECGDVSVFACRDCEDVFCQTCYHMNHRRGKRVMHKFDVFTSSTNSNTMDDNSLPVNNDLEDVSNNEKPSTFKNIFNSVFGSSEKPKPSKSAFGTDTLGEWWEGKVVDEDWFLKRAQYIPLRLTHEERRYLRLLEGVIKASDYGNKVDIVTHKSKRERTRKATQSILKVLQALVAHQDISKAVDLNKNGDFAKYEVYFQHIFEIGRRHKIRNPEKMRSTYSILMYLLQDSQMTEIREFLGFSCVRPIITVYSLLEEKNGLDLLRDPMLAVATQEIITADKSRHEIDSVSRRKREAMDYLLNQYNSSTLTKETIKLVVYSIGDNHAYLRTNRDPCNEMLKYLQLYFKPTEFTSAADSLAVVAGEDGARITHSHSIQYHYVMQSLCLWRDILDDFFRLWCLSEEDLLDTENYPYTLIETGQGIHRLQQPPRTDRALRQIIYRVQKQAGNWVGSSVIHLGDRNVPNSFLFIDKYNQVGKILNPITIVLNNIKKMCTLALDLQAIPSKDIRVSVKHFNHFIALFYQGDYKKAQLDILQDFFKHAFDGSGSDNFFEAGSCIDGRLTSAWEWCNSVVASANLKNNGKKYFPLFQMLDFVGFDGVEWN